MTPSTRPTGSARGRRVSRSQLIVLRGSSLNESLIAAGNPALAIEHAEILAVAGRLTHSILRASKYAL